MSVAASPADVGSVDIVIVNWNSGDQLRDSWRGYATLSSDLSRTLKVAQTVTSKDAK